MDKVNWSDPMRSLVWLSLALASLPALSQTPDPLAVTTPAPPPRVLTASGRIKLGIPMFGAIGNTVCDASGNLYVNAGRLPFQTQGPFLGVQADGRKHVSYVLPQEASSQGSVVWAVSPGGTFYVLHGDFKEYKLVRFKGDGSVAGISSLAIPAGVYVEHLAIADNETMYVGGYRDTPEPLEKPRNGFAALLDASGKLVRDLSSDAPHVDLKASALHPLDGDAVTGEDGRFYVLGSKDVLVLNQAGEVERDWKLQKPNPGAIAARIDYSKGIISVVLQTGHPKPGQVTEVDTHALLLNAQTGQQGDFVFDPSTTGTVLCFNAQDGYSLMAVDGKMAAKDIVPIR
jgi:hypothetical protein